MQQQSSVVIDELGHSYGPGLIDWNLSGILASCPGQTVARSILRPSAMLGMGYYKVLEGEGEGTKGTKKAQ